MARHAGVALSEILDAIEGIENATVNKTLEDFSTDWLLKHGVQRGIEIISEASRHIPDELLEIAPEIPWNQVRNVGNVLRHEYHKVADPIVWAVVRTNLPTLRVAIVRMKATLPESD